MKTHPMAVYGVVLSGFLGYTGAGLGLGYWLWKYRNFPWWCLLVTTMAGLIIATWRLIQYQKRFDELNRE